MAIIAIANETGCGEVMYTNIAKALNYRLVNREMMEYAAKVSGIKKSDLEKMDEKKHSRLNLILNSIFDLSLFSSDNTCKIESGPSYDFQYDTSSTGENFKYATEKVIRMLANEGNVVVVGRGANFILEGYKNLITILLCADIEQRVKNISKSMGLTEKQALKYANETDIKKYKFIKYYYDKDLNDPHNYQMTLNLSKIKEEDAASMLCEIIRIAKI